MIANRIHWIVIKTSDENMQIATVTDIFIFNCDKLSCITMDANLTNYINVNYIETVLSNMLST